MSSPATAAFLAAARNGTRRRMVTLVEIDLPPVGATPMTLRGANNGECPLPDGRMFEVGTVCERIRQTIALLGGGPSPCSTTVKIANHQWAALGGDRTFDTLATIPWQGRNLRIFLWERSLSDVADLYQIFEGRIDRIAVGRDYLTCTVLQDRSSNRKVPKDVISVLNEPNAPEVSLGQVKPWIYGDWNDYEMRSPFTSPYSFKSKQQDAGAGRGAVPLILVDPGLGAAKVKLLAAGHPCADLLDRAAGYTPYIEAGSDLAPLDTAGLTETLGSGSSDAFIEIDDDKLIAYFGVRPIDVRVGQNTALNPRRAMDPFNEQTYATLAQPANGVLELQLPSGNNQGRLESVEIEMIFRGNAGNTHTIRARPYNPVSADAGTAITATSTGTTPATLSGAWDAAWWTQNWDLAGISGTAGPNRTTIDIRVDFSGGTTNTADVIWVILKAKFRPQRSIVVPGSGPQLLGVPARPAGAPAGGLGWWATPSRYAVWAPPIPPQLEVNARFFGNVRGWKDDGSGTYTGVPGQLIESPADIARHFLTVACQQTSFETDYDPLDPTVGFGSFVKARHQLGRGYGGGAKLAVWLGGRQVGAHEVLAKIAQQSLSCILRDPGSGKWQMHLWNRGAPVDYDYLLHLEDVPSIFDPDTTSDVDLLQGYRVQYGYDHFRGRTWFETFVGAGESSMGYSLPQWRDQQPITIAAGTNDKIDYRYDTVASPVAATLTPATYTEPHALADDAETQLNAAIVAAGVTNRKWRVWHGFNVKPAMVNFSIEYIDNVGGAYTGSAGCAIEDKDYRTPEALAAAVTIALNSMQVLATIDVLGTQAILVFSVTYDHQTNKFTVECNYHFRIKVTVVGGTSYTIADGWLNLGWNALFVASARLGHYGSPDPTNGLPGTPITCRTPMYAERYRMLTYHNGSSVTANIANVFLWGTGTNTATNCALELGWDKIDATMPTTGIDQGLYATYPRNMREAVADLSEEDFGPKESGTLVADWVRTEQMGLLLRNGLFDFTCNPMVMLRFSTHVMPDIQRMRVIGFHASVDRRRRCPKYRGTGSWADTPMRVIEIDHEVNRHYRQEIVAVEA